MAKPGHKEIATTIRQLAGKMPQAKLARTIASYLAQERRTSELDAIMREVARQRGTEDGVMEVSLTSAYPLTDGAKRELRKVAAADKVVFNETIDKDVIGGVRMETNEQLLDLTVRDRLNQLKQGATNVK